jgi:hypothetical protein
VVIVNAKIKAYAPYILCFGGGVLLAVCGSMLSSRICNGNGGGIESTLSDYQRIEATQSEITDGIEAGEERAGAIQKRIDTSAARIGTAEDGVDDVIANLEATDLRLAEGERVIASIRRRGKEKAGSATEND